MGSEFSKQERIEYGQYRNLMDKALRDQEPYIQFMIVRDQLADELRMSKPNVNRYIVAYVKKIVKSKKIPNHIKFNALLLLKELMKTKNPALAAYNIKKFMDRLGKLSTSRNGPKVLLEYNSRSSAADSSKFYQLLMECMSHWCQQLGNFFPPYIDAQDKLIRMGRLPIPDVYYDVPQVIIASSSVPMPEKIPDVRNTLDAFKFERIKVLELLRYKGQDAFDDEEIRNEFRVYEEEKVKLDNDMYVQSLLANPTNGSAKDQELAREFGNEIMMYDALKESYFRTDPYDLFAKQHFFKNVDETHKNLFGSSINFAMKSNRDARFDSPHDDIVMSRDKFVPNPNGAGLMASGLHNSNVYGERRMEDQPLVYSGREMSNGGRQGEYDQSGRNGGMNGAYGADMVHNRLNNSGKHGEPPTLKFTNVEQPNSNYNSRREFVEDVNDLRQFGQESRQGYDRPLGSIREEYEPELGTKDRNEINGQPDFLSQPPGAAIPVVEVDFGRNGGRGMGLGGRSFDRENVTLRPGKSTEPIALGRAAVVPGGRKQTPDDKEAANRRSFKLNHLKTETSNRASNYKDEDALLRNPYKGQSMTNSKEFYKAYFGGSGHTSGRSAHKEYQFNTDAIRFVNGMYDDINNAVARNAY